MVDVYTDLVCPWCFIGTERLDKAIVDSSLADRVVVVHHAYLLNDAVPPEGIDVAAHLREKTGRDPATMFAKVEAVAKESGIALDLSKQTRMYSTIPAHALLRAAANKPRGVQRALERDLFRAHFQQQQNISDVGVLSSLAAPHGFTDAEVKAIVADDGAAQQVIADARQASRDGVRGVPYFTFNGASPLSGAQPEAALVAAIQAAAR